MFTQAFLSDKKKKKRIYHCLILKSDLVVFSSPLPQTSDIEKNSLPDEVNKVQTTGRRWGRGPL